MNGKSTFRWIITSLSLIAGLLFFTGFTGSPMTDSSGNLTKIMTASASTEVALVSIRVEPAIPEKLNLGSERRFKAIGIYADGTSRDISSLVKWGSSDESIAVITVDGKASGVAKENLQGPGPPPGMPGSPPGGPPKGGPPGPPGGGPPPPPEGGFPPPPTSVTAEVTITATLSSITSDPVTLTIVTSEGPAVYFQKGGNVIKSKQQIIVSNINESAVKVVGGGIFHLSDSTIKTTGNTSGLENSSFYGLNAGVLAESESKITLENVTIETTGTGANGAFAVGEGTLVELSNVKIVCSATGAHGVDATLGGNLILKNVDIVTRGDGAAAAIATDRGGGNIQVKGGNVLTTGARSPGLYCTGNISVNGGTYVSSGSEAAVIEGRNSIIINDADITGSTMWGVMVYQSFSGDAEMGTGNFTMTGGSLKAEEGPLFFSTNTKSVITLNGVKLDAVSGTILKAAAFQWGTPGKNGADVVFNAENQVLNGNIICDDISTIKISLTNNSILKGTIDAEHNAKSITLNLDKTSIWYVTGTSYVTVLIDDDPTMANIQDNGATIFYDAKNSANSRLARKTIRLKSGGKLQPI